jgi:hypothetical protein
MTILNRWTRELAKLRPHDAQALATEAMLLRAGLRAGAEAVEDVRELAEARPLMDFAGALLVRHGVKDVESLSANQVLNRALEVGLAATLEAASRHAVLMGYDVAPQTHACWVGNTGVKDFNAQELGEVSVSESKHLSRRGGPDDVGTLSGDFEQTAVQTFKKIVQIGRAAMLNDDVAPFLRTSNSFGMSARIAEADVAYAKLEANSTLNDGLATFHTTHGNLMDAAPPTVTSLAAAVAALRSQLDDQGRAINLTPSFLVVPVSVEIGARQAVISIYGSGDPDAPRVLAEPRLTANWYLTCAQTERPALHLITRSASRGPSVSIGRIPNFDGEAAKCVWAFAAAVLSWRGAVKTPLPS